MQVNNLDYFIDEVGGDDLFDDEMLLAGDTMVVPEPVHFLGTSDRRAKYRKRQAELKKSRMADLDEYEIAMQA
ncbi:MAG: hypothetical protein PSN04_00020 [Methyloprofundus sp.]|nr:hypothetical protein [Methyloprofundus sp.]